MSDICTASVKYYRTAQSPTQPREIVREDVDACQAVGSLFLQRAQELAHQQNIPFPERPIFQLSLTNRTTTTITANSIIPAELEISPSSETPKQIELEISPSSETPTQIDSEELDVEVTIDSGDTHIVQAMGKHTLNSVEAHSKISYFIYISRIFANLGKQIVNGNAAAMVGESPIQTEMP